MPDFGPHAAFIWLAYGMTAIAIAGLIAWVFLDEARQRRKLAELEARGIVRRSARNASGTTTGQGHVSPV